MALIVIPALLLAGYASYKSGNWIILLVVFCAWIAWSIAIGTINLLSKAFRGKPIIYDTRIDQHRKGGRATYE
jgi:hypothetical protein